MTTQISYEPCHLPCPDMRHHSLTQEDKDRGLVWVKKVRAELESKRVQNETDRERRNRRWRMKLREKSLRLPDRVVRRNQNETAQY